MVTMNLGAHLTALPSVRAKPTPHPINLRLDFNIAVDNLRHLRG
jgi:hypothetical protein